jgi:hypothetical protein
MHPDNFTPNRKALKELLVRASYGDLELSANGLPILAGAAAMPQNPVAMPLGPATVDGTTITVDTYVNPPVQIPGIIRNLVAANQGYFAEQIFSTPGFTVTGGAIIYEETFPEDYFLPAGKEGGPRAPGAPAKRLGSTRRPIKAAYPESWAGSIEVTDEARTRNKVIAVRRQFTQAANTIANNIQTRALEYLQDKVEEWERQNAGKNWHEARPEGLVNVDPFTMPHRDIALEIKLFQEDKVGVLPDTIILNTEDNFFLTVLYSSFPNGGLDGMLRSYGINKRLVSVLAPEGNPYFLQAGGIGVMAFEKPLTQEYSRVGERFTDVFSLDVAPVLVAYDASTIRQLTGVNA